MARHNLVQKGELQVDWIPLTFDTIYNGPPGLYPAKFIGRVELCRRWWSHRGNGIDLPMTAVNWEDKLRSFLVHTQDVRTCGFCLHLYRQSGRLRVYLMRQRMVWGGCKDHFYQDVIGEITNPASLRWCWETQDEYYDQHYDSHRAIRICRKRRKQKNTHSSGAPCSQPVDCIS